MDWIVISARLAGSEMVYELCVEAGLSGYLSGNLVMELHMIRQLRGDILSELIVHRDIRDTSIFLTSQGTFRLADFSLDRRIRELLQEMNNLDVEEAFPPSVGREDVGHLPAGYPGVVSHSRQLRPVPGHPSSCSNISSYRE